VYTRCQISVIQHSLPGTQTTFNHLAIAKLRFSPCSYVASIILPLATTPLSLCLSKLQDHMDYNRVRCLPFCFPPCNLLLGSCLTSDSNINRLSVFTLIPFIPSRLNTIHNRVWIYVSFITAIAIVAGSYVVRLMVRSCLIQSIK
jgi:hypothetical protein